MKMLKGIILILLCCSLVVAHTQTKEETKSWLLEKLNKYSKGLSMGGVGIFGKDFLSKYGYSFSFDKNYLIIKYKERQTGYDSTVKNCSEKIPVYDIKNVMANSINTIIYINTSSKTIINSCDNLGDMVSDICPLGLAIDSETDLEKRLNKAFLHLKQFFKKPVNKEMF